MLDKKNQVLYVGKAKNLPNRLKSYALDKNQTTRTERMLALTQNLEIITTNSEAEALLLEANLIKKFKPKFNVLLRDDKSFPYIFIEKDCDWPKLLKHRGKKNKNGYYFGPFASVGSANWTIKILQKVFLLRVCNNSVFKNRDRPCILYQIKRCSAPMATDGGINESGQAITAEVRIGDFVDSRDISIYRQLAGGVTVANILHGSANPIGGQNQVIKLRWGALPDQLKFASAPPGIKFALGENVKQSNWGDGYTTRYPQTRMGVEQTYSRRIPRRRRL